MFWPILIPYIYMNKSDIWRHTCRVLVDRAEKCFLGVLWLMHTLAYLYPFFFPNSSQNQDGRNMMKSSKGIIWNKVNGNSSLIIFPIELVGTFSYLGMLEGKFYKMIVGLQCCIFRIGNKKGANKIDSVEMTVLRWMYDEAYKDTLRKQG